MKNWTAFLKSNEVSNEFKIIIEEFLFPDNILIDQYFVNLKSLNNSIPFPVNLISVSNSLLLPIVFPPFYPELIIAAYPDVIVNLINYPENSKVFKSLTEDLLSELENDYIQKHNFLRLLINEYKIHINPILECTEQFKKEDVKKKLLYPIINYDNLGRLENKVEFTNGFEETTRYIYDDIDQIIRIDKWGEDSYGEWKLSPYMMFEYDSNGLINHIIEYEHMQVYEEISFTNVYVNNEIVTRKGSKIVIKEGSSNLKKTYKDFYLEFTYNGDYVNIYEYFLNVRIRKEDLIRTLNSYTGLDIFSID